MQLLEHADAASFWRAARSEWQQGNIPGVMLALISLVEGRVRAGGDA